MQSHAQEKNTALSKTINEDRNSGRIACNKCDYTCQFNIQLRKHVNKKHVEIKNTAQQFGCEKCAYKCDTGTTLRAHIEAYHIKDIFKCNYCGFEDETEDNLRMHVQSNHNSNQNIYYPCDECEVRTPRINDLVLHKKTIHGILKYACDLCEHSDTLLEGLWRHKVVDHQAFEPDTPEATYHMQQMLLISLSAQVEFLVNSMAKLNVQTAQGFLENKTHMDKLEGKLDTVDERVHDLDTALAKTTRFDNKIQNDSQAVLTKVSAKCAEIENLVLHVAKRKAVAESNPIRDEPGTEEHDGLKKKDTAEEKNDEIDKADDAFENVYQRRRNRKHKVTWVGTSLSKVLDKEKFEKDIDVELTMEKAYCIEEEGRFKQMNFKAIVPKLVEKGDIDTLVLQTGSIEITNIEANKAMMDASKDISKYKKEWYEKAEKDSTNLFAIAEDAIKKDPNLNVIIVKRPPRFDRASKDISRIKSQLSKFSNHVYDQLWLKNGSPAKIHIVELELGCENSQYLREIIYGQPQNPKYDGIHLLGKAASRHFTYRAVQIMLPIVNPSLVPVQQFPSLRRNFRAKTHMPENEQLSADWKTQDDGHTNCEQAQYQRQSDRGSHGVRRSRRRNSDVLKNVDQRFSVPTKNFYEPLNC